ncbi:MULTISPECIES: ectoine synthase [unclassified Mesorhizobium]|uniref:ectoine synthase n=1 Tax=unclassified Mesorhizobium TaxID=325217 RepID=UPI000FE83168|nr:MULTISPECIES: ectoine synthase [unclassified Mesorhizobium]RWB93768.1 MAG: cupin domain-containing protein [Mesorhizobium sp.]TGV18176.1 cupin domain-containing protein [Mesorhizobium sp. M4B.F.Ca.ET.143.01.1.1]
MIYRTLKQLIDSTYDVAWGNGQSRRLLVRDDGVGYSLTDTIVRAGTESLLRYSNHLETCYCIEGEGEVQVGKETFRITPGCMYALNGHEKHYLRAKTDLRLICVFSPALVGHEKHQLDDLNGSSY